MIESRIEIMRFVLSYFFLGGGVPDAVGEPSRNKQARILLCSFIQEAPPLRR